jgi:hypothetical protein
MAQNDRTIADLWFEALLKQEGLGSQREPDWSAVAGKTVTKNPDYLVDIDGQPVVVEVKSFESSPERDAVWNRVGYFTTSAEQEYGPIREAIKAAAGQLKPFAGLGMPLIVVLANPPQPDGSRVMVTLDWTHIFSAMYGDFAVTAPFDHEKLGDFQPAATRNGQVARQHLYLSAVIVLWPRDERFVVSIYETSCYEATPLPDAAFAGALWRRSGIFDMETGSYGVKFEGPAFMHDSGYYGKRRAIAAPSAARMRSTAPASLSSSSPAATSTARSSRSSSATPSAPRSRRWGPLRPGASLALRNVGATRGL